MSWYPEIAAPAYYGTVKLRKVILERQRLSRSSRPPVLEPSSAEFIAALAAGINAHHILQVGCGMSTIALAVAARCTGCQLISVDDDSSKQELVQQHMKHLDLLQHVKWVCEDPLLYVPTRENVEFAYITGPAETYIQLFDSLKLRPNSIVVADNALLDSTNDYIKHVREQPGVDSSTLFVGRGIEISKIVSWDKFRRGRKIFNSNRSHPQLLGTGSNASSIALNLLSIGSNSTISHSFKDLRTLLKEPPDHPVSPQASSGTVGDQLSNSCDVSNGFSNVATTELIECSLLKDGLCNVLKANEVENMMGKGSVQQDGSGDAEENDTRGSLPPSVTLISHGSVKCNGNGQSQFKKEVKHFAVQVDMGRDSSGDSSASSSGSSLHYENLQRSIGNSLIQLQKDLAAKMALEQICNGREIGTMGVGEYCTVASGDALCNMDDSALGYKVNFKNDPVQTEITIEGIDQDMLLTDITLAFNETGVSVRRAKIATQDKHVEDVFYCVDGKSQAPIDVARWDVVRQRILVRIAERKVLNGVVR